MPIDPRIHSRRIAVARDRGRRRLHVIAVFVVIVALAGSTVALLYAGPLRARHVTVTGTVHTSPREVVTAARLTTDPPLIDVDPGRAATEIESLPWVSTARVERRWPDSVSVVVTERTPALAEVLAPGRWAELDATGRVLAVVGRPTGLPALAGPALPGLPGTALPSVMKPALHVAATLPRAFAGQVTALAVDRAANVTLTLNSGLTVVLGTDVDLQLKYEDVAALLAGADLSSDRAIDVIVPQSPLVSPTPLNSDGTPSAGG